MWGKILMWGLGALAAGVVAAIVIDKIIEKRDLQKALRDKDLQRGIVTEINRASNKIKLSDLDSDEEIELQGKGIASDINEGDVIYAA